MSFGGVSYLILTVILALSTWRSKKNLVGPNLAAMAKNVHFYLTSSGPKKKMFATPTNFDSMIFRKEKCHIFIIYHKKYVNGSFRGPNGPKTKILSFWPLFLLLPASSENLCHHQTVPKAYFWKVFSSPTRISVLWPWDLVIFGPK